MQANTEIEVNSILARVTFLDDPTNCRGLAVDDAGAGLALDKAVGEQVVAMTQL